MQLHGSSVLERCTVPAAAELGHIHTSTWHAAAGSCANMFGSCTTVPSPWAPRTLPGEQLPQSPLPAGTSHLQPPGLFLFTATGTPFPSKPPAGSAVSAVSWLSWLPSLAKEIITASLVICARQHHYKIPSPPRPTPATPDPL